MCLTHKFLVVCHLLPAVAPSEILLVAKFFTPGSSIYLPRTTSTFTQASNLIALLKLSQWKLQLWKRSKGEVRQQKSSAGWHQSTLHSLKNKQTNKQQQNQTVTLYLLFFWSLSLSQHIVLSEHEVQVICILMTFARDAYMFRSSPDLRDWCHFYGFNKHNSILLPYAFVRKLTNF